MSYCGNKGKELHDDAENNALSGSTQIKKHTYDGDRSVVLDVQNKAVRPQWLITLSWFP